MITLTQKLTAETQILKEEYLLQTKIYSEKEFKRFTEISAMDRAAYYTLFGVTFEMKRYNDDPKNPLYLYVEYISREKGGKYYGGDNYKLSKKVDLQVSAIRNTVAKGLEAYLSKQNTLAIKHYEGSIAKLSSRIKAKNLNEETLVIKTGRVGVNIETVLTDGVKTVKAWTIVASGLIQRPHYRYLIK